MNCSKNFKNGVNNMQELVKYGEELLHEIHFWTVNIRLMEKAAEKEEKRILDLWSRVIKEIDRKQIERDYDESKSKS